MQRRSLDDASASYSDVSAVIDAVEMAEERLAAEAEAEAEESRDALANLHFGDEPSGSRTPVASRRAAPDPAAASLLKRDAGQIFSSGDFISGQVHENDKAEVVIVCEPGACCPSKTCSRAAGEERSQSALSCARCLSSHVSHAPVRHA